VQHEPCFGALRDFLQPPLDGPPAVISQALEQGRKIAVEEHAYAHLGLEKQRACVVEKRGFRRARGGAGVREERPARVVVRASHATGKIQEIEGAGLLARALCHEIDHLNSTLYVDRLRGLKRELTKKKLERRAARGFA